MELNYRNKTPKFTYTIDLYDVLKLAYSQFPKMRIYGERIKVAYLPCRVHSIVIQENEEIEIQKGGTYEKST